MNDNVKCKSKYLGSLIVNKNNKAENMVGIKRYNILFVINTEYHMVF